ncbi:MAG: pseudouridine synthase, partial [Oscillospiraceae bacterium]
YAGTETIKRNKNMLIRLDKYISSQLGDISRSKVKELCRKGKITVNGNVCKKSDIKIQTDKDMIVVDGKEIKYKEHIYIMLNKPQGVVCSTRDGKSPTVLSLVPKELFREGMFPAGRLDKDTEGFVLITDDGEFAHRILAPKSHVPKTYLVKLEKPLDKLNVEKFEKGLTIDGGEKCMPAKLMPDEKNEFLCKLEIHEGKYHQVKRMFQSVGNKVVHLKRIAMGNLVLDNGLKPGECREISDEEIGLLVSK